MISDKSARDIIRQLNATDETEDIEVKLGSEAGRSALQTICSLSNEPDLGGGTILLGVRKEAPRRTTGGANSPGSVIPFD